MSRRGFYADPAAGRDSALTGFYKVSIIGIMKE
jgi:hypothetical protein